jgi:hypothetical protein
MFKANAKVEWKWLGRTIEGRVCEVHTEKVVRTIKGKKITRNGSKENPAYVVESSAGNLALKLHSELQPLSAKKKTKRTPSLFSD